MALETSEQYIAGMMRALEIMRAHDRSPDHYLSGIAAIEKEIRKKVEERMAKMTRKIYFNWTALLL